MDARNKELKQHFSNTQLQSFTPYSPTPLSLMNARGWRMGVYGQSTTAPLCYCFLLTLFLCSRMVHSMGYSVGICSTVVLHRLQRVFAPVPGACPYHPSLTLVFTLVLLTNFFFFFYPLLFFLCGVVFCPFLNTFSQVCHQLG